MKNFAIERKHFLLFMLLFIMNVVDVFLTFYSVCICQIAQEINPLFTPTLINFLMKVFAPLLFYFVWLFVTYMTTLLERGDPEKVEKLLRFLLPLRSRDHKIRKKHTLLRHLKFIRTFANAMLVLLVVLYIGVTANNLIQLLLWSGSF